MTSEANQLKVTLQRWEHHQYFDISECIGTPMELVCQAPFIDHGDNPKCSLEERSRIFNNFVQAVNKNGKYVDNQWQLSITFKFLASEPTSSRMNVELRGNLMENLYNLTNGHLELNFTGFLIVFNGIMMRQVDDVNSQFVFSEKISLQKSPEGCVVVELSTSIRGSLTNFIASDRKLKLEDFKFTLTCPENYFNDEVASQGDFILRKILDEGIHPDFYFIGENGVKIPCNKAVLAAHSAELAGMLNSRMKEAADSRMELKRDGGKDGLPISEKGIRAFLRFLYCQEENPAEKNSSIAMELLELGHQYGVPKMESEMKRVFMRNPLEWCEADVALQIFYHSNSREGYGEIKERMIKVLKLKREELQDSELYLKLHPTEAGRELFEATLTMIK